MRYAVYITRGEHWSFEARERVPISEAEWNTYANHDTELRPLLFSRLFDARTGKEVGRVPLEKTWEWTAHPRGADSGTPRTFEYNRGGIIVRRPDAEVLRKATAVANALGAKVIGDDENPDR